MAIEAVDFTSFLVRSEKINAVFRSRQVLIETSVLPD